MKLTFRDGAVFLVAAFACCAAFADGWDAGYGPQTTGQVGLPQMGSYVDPYGGGAPTPGMTVSPAMMGSYPAAQQTMSSASFPTHTAGPGVSATVANQVQSYGNYVTPPSGATYGTSRATSPGQMPAAPVPSNASFATSPGAATAPQGMATGSYFNAMQAPWGDAPCGPVCLPPPVPRAPKWFGGIYGLVMNRYENDGVCLITDPWVTNNHFASTQSAEMENSGGVEVRLGTTFGCGNYGLEFVYWEIFPNDRRSQFNTGHLPAGSAYGTIDYRDLYFDYVDPTGTPWSDTIANQYTESGNLTAVQIERDWKFRNYEINLLSRPLAVPGCGCKKGCGPAVGACGNGGPLGYAGYPGSTAYGPAIGSAGYGGPVGGGDACGPVCGPVPCPPRPPRLNIGWLFGFRYFRFDDDLFLAYDNYDTVIHADWSDPYTEFDHDIEVENELYGFQLGLNMDYFVAKCLRLEAGSKFGLYGNHMSHYQRVYNLYGPAYSNPADPQCSCVKSSDDDVAFLGELRAGLAYKVSCNCRLTGGYRVVALSGVALATEQLPTGRLYSSPDKVARINRDNSLILHGLYGGLEFAW